MNIEKVSSIELTRFLFRVLKNYAEEYENKNISVYNYRDMTESAYKFAHHMMLERHGVSWEPGKDGGSWHILDKDKLLVTRMSTYE